MLLRYAKRCVTFLEYDIHNSNLRDVNYGGDIITCTNCGGVTSHSIRNVGMLADHTIQRTMSLYMHDIVY